MADSGGSKSVMVTLSGDYKKRFFELKEWFTAQKIPVSTDAEIMRMALSTYFDLKVLKIEDETITDSINDLFNKYPDIGKLYGLKKEKFIEDAIRTRIIYYEQQKKYGADFSKEAEMIEKKRGNT